MKKLILAAAMTASFAAGYVHAEDAKPDNEITYNVGIVNDYRYRGLTQTRFDPALQGGADWVNNPTGFYAGTWLSTIKWIKDAGTFSTPPVDGKGPVEWDIYAGKRGDIGAGFTYDVGGLYYFYPRNNLADNAPTFKNANTFELYGQLGYGPLYFKYSQSLTNLFGNPDSKYSKYYDIGGNFDVGYGVTLGLHAGHQDIKGPGSIYSYVDWKIGLTKTFDELAGVTLGVAYVATDLANGLSTTPASDGLKNVGKSGVVFSLSKTF